MRFRRLLVCRSLDHSLFEAITAQLKTRAIRIKIGTIVDATIIASHTEQDSEARWIKHKGKKAVHGFKAHVGADATTALVEKISITPANINDGRAGPDALPDNRARCLPIAPIGDRISVKPCAPGAAASAWRRRGCGDATKRRRLHA